MERARASRVLTLAYAPVLVWSAIGSVWTFSHHRFSLVFVLVWGLAVVPSLILKRTVGNVLVMGGIAGCHMLAAFALHAWLRLPLWNAALFVVASFALLIAHVWVRRA
jgi:hypothetical protein